MKKNILNKYFLALSLLLAFGSCKAKKAVMVADVPKAIKSDTVFNKATTAEITDSIRARQLSFSTLAVKAKASITIDKKENDVTLNIRIKKDQAIWISVTGFGGIEGARALITPDSIRIMDKLNDVYLKKPFTYIHDYANQQINFSILQSILAGNIATEFLEKPETANGTKLTGSLNSLLYSISIGPGFRIEEASFKDVEMKEELALSYTGIAPQSLPQSVSLKSISEKAFVLKMEYSKPVLNQLVEMPFTVPKRFEIID